MASLPSSNFDIQVSLCKLTGDTVTLTMPALRGSIANNVGDLKALVHERTQLLPLLQRLIFDGRVLEAPEELHTLAVDGKLSLALVTVPPYNGDIQAAMRAGDRPAVKYLIEKRDQDRGMTTIPAQLTLVTQRRWRDARWDRVGEALQEIGYPAAEVEAAFECLAPRSQMLQQGSQGSGRGVSYMNMEEHLSQRLGPRPRSDVHATCQSTADNEVTVTLAKKHKLVEIGVAFENSSEAAAANVAVYVNDDKAPLLIRTPDSPTPTGVAGAGSKTQTLPPSFVDDSGTLRIYIPQVPQGQQVRVLAQWCDPSSATTAGPILVGVKVKAVLEGNPFQTWWSNREIAPMPQTAASAETA